MDFVKHPKHSRFIGKPRDWNEKVSGECSTLSVQDKIEGGFPVMESAWLPTPEEAMALAVGYGKICLGVYGQIHPVVYMGTLPMTPPSREEYRAKLLHAAKWLKSLADSGGIDLRILGDTVTADDKDLA